LIEKSDFSLNEHEWGYNIDKKMMLGSLNSYQQYIKEISGYKLDTTSKFDNYHGKAGKSHMYGEKNQLNNLKGYNNVQ